MLPSGFWPDGHERIAARWEGIVSAEVPCKIVLGCRETSVQTGARWNCDREIPEARKHGREPLVLGAATQQMTALEPNWLASISQYDASFLLPICLSRQVRHQRPQEDRNQSR